MSKNTIKRSLLASVFALVLCVAMLVGSTFAWFTDTATTGVNKIQSGKLDVKLTYLTDNNEWKEVTKDTKLFKDGAL
jgi:predicted ribosomally synthesized peptide with SipW-like signal peptide